MKTLILSIFIALMFLSCEDKIEILSINKNSVIDSKDIEKFNTVTTYYSDSTVTLYYNSPTKTVNIKSKGSYTILDTLESGSKITTYLGDLKRKTGTLKFSISDNKSTKLNCTATDSIFVAGVKIVNYN
ncbi:gp233 [Sphingomonas phage PAU]|uniref:gp233 n=1 Tax=Sphingomonas phage PAU TaxID=1150991 RepID=UPI0002573387|nr:gp233 [Sphingomonas phage PAU]AFF28231.1 gp233 [Sphingomonas phage PAU]